MPEDFGCAGKFCGDVSCAVCRQGRRDDFHPAFFGNVGPLQDDSGEMRSNPEDDEPSEDEAER